MKALVTGGGGFLGQAIVRQLRQVGVHVRSLARGQYAWMASMGVECLRGDIRDAASVDRACQGMDVVFHVAAVAGIWGNWEYYYGINTEGTRNVLNSCRRHEVPRLVYTSSPSVTFAVDDQCGIDESAAYASQWLCPYPYTKALAEQDILSANDGQRLRTCALRPHLIWGPGDPHLIPRLLQRARTGRLRQVGDGTNQVDIVYVENAAAAHLLAAERLQPGSAVCGQAYFISQGEPVNCWQWINEILERAGVPRIRRSISFETAWRLGHLMEITYRLLRKQSEPPMTRFLAAQLAKSHYYCIAKARRELQYEPHISIDQGMRRLANSWDNG